MHAFKLGSQIRKKYKRSNSVFNIILQNFPRAYRINTFENTIEERAHRRRVKMLFVFHTLFTERAHSYFYN